MDDDKCRVTAVCIGGDFLQLSLAARQQMDLIQGGGMNRTDWEGELKALTKQGFSGEPGS